MAWAISAKGFIVSSGYFHPHGFLLATKQVPGHEAGAAALAAAEAGGQGKDCLFAVLSGEIGGGNGVEALVTGAQQGLPIVDADFMGRAFPELQMMTPAIYGMPSVPAALADEKGNVVIVTQTGGGDWLERLLRPVCQIQTQSNMKKSCGQARLFSAGSVCSALLWCCDWTLGKFNERRIAAIWTCWFQVFMVLGV